MLPVKNHFVYYDSNTTETGVRHGLQSHVNSTHITLYNWTLQPIDPRSLQWHNMTRYDSECFSELKSWHESNQQYFVKTEKHNNKADTKNKQPTYTVSQKNQDT